MADVVEPPRWLLYLPRHWVAGTGTVVCVALMGAMFVAPPAADLALGIVTIAVGALGTWAYNKRRALDVLPLVLGDCAVLQAVAGDPVMRVRTWLGHGRAMADLSVHAVLQTPNLDEVPLRVDLPVTEAVGPLTITAYLPPLALGEVRVEVRATEGGQRWEASRIYPVVRMDPGALDVPVRWKGDRLMWDRAAWDRRLSDG